MTRQVLSIQKKTKKKRKTIQTNLSKASTITLMLQIAMYLL